MSPSEIINVYHDLSPVQKDELFQSIRKGYADLTTKKSKGDFPSSSLKRLMDGFLNLEDDALSSKIESIDDLKNIFMQTRQRLGTESTVDFESAIAGAQYLQNRLRDAVQLV